MTKQELSLIMNFKNTQGKETTITLNHIKEGLTSEEVAAVMDAIIANNLFESSGGSLVSKVKAQIVDKTTNVITM
ncbi:MAG: DUF2922 domain-containing protein [Sarcina sp.]